MKLQIPILLSVFLTGCAVQTWGPKHERGGSTGNNSYSILSNNKIDSLPSGSQSPSDLLEELKKDWEAIIVTAEKRKRYYERGDGVIKFTKRVASFGGGSGAVYGGIASVPALAIAGGAVMGGAEAISLMLKDDDWSVYVERCNQVVELRPEVMDVVSEWRIRLTRAGPGGLSPEMEERFVNEVGKVSEKIAEAHNKCLSQ